jgi:hypothetical protein
MSFISDDGLIEDKERCASMNKRIRKLIVLLCLLLLAGSCGFSKSVYESVSESVSDSYDSVFSDSPVLKKRVLVLPFLDQAGLGPEKVNEFTDVFLSLLNKGGDYLIQKADAAPNPRVRSRVPEFGIVADPDQVKRASEMGMNVMITVVLSPEDASTRKKGIWPFRKVVADVEIPMIVNAYDVVNGTLLLTNLESAKIETSVEEFDEFFDENPGKLKYELDPEEVNKAWAGILERQAAALNKRLKAQPWMGRVLSVDTAGAVVNAGKDVGLKEGAVFEVLGEAETIQSASGKPVALMGPRIAELKVKEIDERRALATPLSDAKLQAGQIIRIKR